MDEIKTKVTKDEITITRDDCITSGFKRGLRDGFSRDSWRNISNIYNKIANKEYNLSQGQEILQNYTSGLVQALSSLDFNVNLCLPARIPATCSDCCAKNSCYREVNEREGKLYHFD